MHPLTRIPAVLRPYLPWLGFCLLAGLVFAAYYPGLHGPFLLDDWATLPSLGAYGPVNNFKAFVSYITSGIAGISGRPLALATFLIDAHHWPADPWPFKLTNVILQLLNGFLLAWLLARLTRFQGFDRRKAAWVGMLGAGLWMAHPLFVSTTLYVVQRMAMLAAFFVFAGLVCYVAGRERLITGRRKSAYLLMVTGIAGGTLLGFLSKENAALLPLLALVLEMTVLRKGAPDPSKPATVPSLTFRSIFLWLPTAFILAYLLWQLRDISTVVPSRDFSIGTRLLTESRVLVEYLYLLVIPHAWTHGLFTVVPLSRDLLHPWTTLPAIALILALLAGAFLVRRRWPVIAAAVLFFLAGQALESTTIPLELYYEHRNYLPAALLFWPLAIWFVRGPGGRSLRYSSVVISFIVLLTLTGLRANLWGNPTRLSLTWMRLNPGSVRAVVMGANTLESLGKNRLAYQRLYIASHAHPNNISAALARVDAACRLGRATPDDVRALIRAAGHDWSRLHLLYESLSNRIGGNETCPGFGTDAIARIVTSAKNNPHYRGVHGASAKLYLLRGQLLLKTDHPDTAFLAFSSALKSRPSPDLALTASAYLLNAGYPGKAGQILDKYQMLPRHLPPVWSMRGLHRRWLDYSGWYRESYDSIENAIKEAEQKRHTVITKHSGA